MAHNKSTTHAFPMTIPKDTREQLRADASAAEAGGARRPPITELVRRRIDIVHGMSDKDRKTARSMGCKTEEDGVKYLAELGALVVQNSVRFMSFPIVPMG